MSKKTFFILLGCLAILFVVALSMNFIGGGKSSAGEATNKPWLQWMDGVFSAFAPAMDIKRIRVPTLQQCTWNQGTHRLTLRGNCRVSIRQQSGEQYQNMVVKFPSNVAVKVFNANIDYQKDQFKNCNTNTAIGTSNSVLVAFKPSGADVEAKADPLRYMNKPQSICWEAVKTSGTKKSPEVKVVVLEEGGDLQFGCFACQGGRLINVSIR